VRMRSVQSNPTCRMLVSIQLMVEKLQHPPALRVRYSSTCCTHKQQSSVAPCPQTSPQIAVLGAHQELWCLLQQFSCTSHRGHVAVSLHWQRRFQAPHPPPLHACLPPRQAIRHYARVYLQGCDGKAPCGNAFSNDSHQLTVQSHANTTHDDVGMVYVIVLEPGGTGDGHRLMRTATPHLGRSLLKTGSGAFVDHADVRRDNVHRTVHINFADDPGN
jgi:hypothetical protein